MQFVEEMYLIFKIILIVSFIMFIVRGIMKDAHNRTKGIVYLSVSSGLLLLFSVAYVIDQWVIEFSYPERNYFYWMGACLGYVIFSITMLIRSKKFARPVKKKMVYTYRPKVEHVYLFFKYGTVIYLLKDSLSGIKYKLKKTEFADEVIKKILANTKVSVNHEVERNGIVTVKGDKTDDVFYCYMVKLDSFLKDNAYVDINLYQIDKFDMLDFDKFVVLKCLSSSSFDDNF